MRSDIFFLILISIIKSFCLFEHKHIKARLIYLSVRTNKCEKTESTGKIFPQSEIRRSETIKENRAHIKKRCGTLSFESLCS